MTLILAVEGPLAPSPAVVEEAVVPASDPEVGALVFGVPLEAQAVEIVDAAEHAQTLGAALSHASLNIGNSLGAFLGGTVIAAGWGLRAPLLVGVGLALAGLVVLALARRAERSARQGE